MIYLYIYLAIYVLQVYFGILMICKEEGSFDISSDDSVIFGVSLIPIAWLFILIYILKTKLPVIQCSGFKLFFEKKNNDIM